MQMLIRWVSVGFVTAVGKVLTWVLAPVLAVFIRYGEEKDVIGFPSKTPGKPRAFLVRRLMGFQTHDAPLDEFWFGGYHKSKWAQEQYEKHSLLRYWMRVRWLWRNPGYGFAHDLGLDQIGMESLGVINTAPWRSKQSGWFLEMARNARGQLGFEFKGQWHYSKTRHLEFRLGYGLFRHSPKKRAITYVRVLPFRRTTQ